MNWDEGSAPGAVKRLFWEQPFALLIHRVQSRELAALNPQTCHTDSPQRGKGPVRKWKRLHYCCRGRLWPKNVFSALPVLPSVLPMPTQTPGRSALFSPQTLARILPHSLASPCRASTSLGLRHKVSIPPLF